MLTLLGSVFGCFCLFEEGVYTAHCVLGILQFGLVPYRIVGGGEFGVHIGCTLLIGSGWRPGIDSVHVFRSSWIGGVCLVSIASAHSLLVPSVDLVWDAFHVYMLLNIEDVPRSMLYREFFESWSSLRNGARGGAITGYMLNIKDGTFPHLPIL